MGGFINHLPMVKFALFSLTKNIKKVESYVEYYLNNYNIDKMKENYEKVDSLEVCLGKKELYESCLDFIRNNTEEENIEELLRSTLSKYTLGLSSDLFHTLIRLSHAMEVYQTDKKLKPEVERALAYYITCYREGGLFKRYVSKDDVLVEINKLIEDKEFKEIRYTNMSLGQKLRKLYSDENYLKRGFIIEGKEKDKVKRKLGVLMPAFYNTDNIVMIHCITGLQAVITLKNYFEDYMVALDIHATTALTHLLTQTDLDIVNRDFKAQSPKQKWLTDVTKFKYGSNQKAYLSAILDLYDMSIISYVLGHSNNNQLVFKTLDKALDYSPGARPLFHNDRGFQYTSKQFKRKLDVARITQSMSRVGKCIDNGPMEGFFGIIKCEKYYLNRYKTFDELNNAIKEYFDFYNYERIQKKTKRPEPNGISESSRLVLFYYFRCLLDREQFTICFGLFLFLSFFS